MKKVMDAAPDKAELSEVELKMRTSYYLAIRGYYYDKGFYGEASKLDKIAAEKLKTDQALLNYLESLVVADKTEQAQSLISKATDKLKSGPSFDVLRLLVHGRIDGPAGILEQANNLEIDPLKNPRGTVYLSCIYLLKDNQEKAFDSLVKAFENTPPTQMSMTRNLVERMNEFNTVRKTEKYIVAIQTKSKVHLSDCTGGSSCNSCSLKEKCASSK